MKRITVEIPDVYDDTDVITAIGNTMGEKHATELVALEGHDGETLVICPHERPEWRKPETVWIPVEERLPEDRQEVLVCTKKSKRTLQAMFWIYSMENYYDFVVASGGYLPVDAVTHWMPLPEPPEEV